MDEFEMAMKIQELEGMKYQHAQRLEAIAFAQRLEKLANMPEFQDIIMQEYCVKEAAALVGESADPALNIQQRADSLAMAQSGGHLRRWIRIKLQMAQSFKDEMPTYEETMRELELTIAGNQE